MTRAEVGKRGETLAEEYLQKQGVRIVAKNYSVHGGEIDLIGYRRGGLIYYEVKTRTGVSWGTARDAMHEDKIRSVEYAAKQFVRQHVSYGNIPVCYPLGLWIPRRVRFQRIDGIEVYLNPDGTLQSINRIEDIGYEIRQHALDC